MTSLTWSSLSVNQLVIRGPSKVFCNTFSPDSADRIYLLALPLWWAPRLGYQWFFQCKYLFPLRLRWLLCIWIFFFSFKWTCASLELLRMNNAHHLRDQGSHQNYCHPLKFLAQIHPIRHEGGQDMDCDAHRGRRDGS
jgi:hypothetical protein